MKKTFFFYLFFKPQNFIQAFRKEEEDGTTYLLKGQACFRMDNRSKIFTKLIPTSNFLNNTKLKSNMCEL